MFANKSAATARLLLIVKGNMQKRILILYVLLLFKVSDGQNIDGDREDPTKVKLKLPIVTIKKTVINIIFPIGMLQQSTDCNFKSSRC